MKTLTPVTSRINSITLSLTRGSLRNTPRALATTLGRRLALPLFFLGAALLVQPCAATPGEWEYTGSLNTGRGNHAATLLLDGKVLVCGGYAFSDGDLASAELYDPVTGEWALTGSLNTARTRHTATLLSDGRVLVAGGVGSGGYLASAELYDPETGEWSLTGSLNIARGFDYTATLLSDGRVLVAGGNTAPFSGGDSTEIYDPATGTWTITGNLFQSTDSHTATLLRDGSVLVAGGRSGSSSFATVELYNPAHGVWDLIHSLNTARYAHAATLLYDGRVLVFGGINSSRSLDSAELFDPATRTWTVTGSLNESRTGMSTLLFDGRVLAAGDNTTGSTELYDPVAGTWSFTGSLNTGRGAETVTLLSNGEVLVAGGFQSTNTLKTAELYQPGVSARMIDGRGILDNQGNEVTFKFRATQAVVGSRLGNFSFCDPAASVCITRAAIRTLSITGNSAEFGGRGQLDDGSRVDFSVSVTDNGKPGTSDTMSINVSNGYSVTGALSGGDIRIY